MDLFSGLENNVPNILYRSEVGLTAGKLMCSKAVVKSDSTYIHNARLEELFLQLSETLKSLMELWGVFYQQPSARSINTINVAAQWVAFHQLNNYIGYKLSRG